VLAVPTIFSASVYKLFSYVKDGASFEANQVHLLVLGNVVAFLVGVLAIKYFIGFLTKYGFKLFGYYRIAIGLTILVLHFLGVKLGML
jgi:undecaprenyl-diphosphatase